MRDEQEREMRDQQVPKRRVSDTGRKAKGMAKAMKVKAVHTMESDETLSHLALRYYGKATKPYWMVIYEANKEKIGDNPNRVKVGLVLKIPELPPDFEA